MINTLQQVTQSLVFNRKLTNYIPGIITGRNHPTLLLVVKAVGCRPFPLLPVINDCSLGHVIRRQTGPLDYGCSLRWAGLSRTLLIKGHRSHELGAVSGTQ